MITQEEVEKIKNERVEDLYRYKSWSAEVYSFGKILRKYGYYPNFLPLYISTDHGPSQSDQPTPAELEYNYFAHFYHSERLFKKFKSVSDKKCFVIKSPFVWYRKKKKKSQSVNPKGTIVFPTHSTHHISIEKNWNEYIEKLLNLPEKYKPISACLYFLDVKSGLNKIFEDAGIETFCAGTWTDKDFVDKFYEIIKNFKYASSAVPGSYLFYAVELGLDFFIYGDEPIYINSSDKNAKKIGRYKLDHNNTQIEKVSNLFKIDNSNSHIKQALVNEELGICKESISRFKFTKILYAALFSYFLSKIINKILK